jgi:multidrug resistance efflux pump
VSTFEQQGERWGLAMAVSGLAQVEEWRNDLTAAAAHYERAAALAGELGTIEDEAQFRLHLAHVLWRLGGAARDRARAEVARAEEGYGAGLGQIAAVTCTARGYLDAAEDNLAAARSWLNRGLAAALPTGDAPVIAEVLTGMADVAVRSGDAAGAATMLGAADGVRGTADRSDEDGAWVTAAARAALGQDGYDAAFGRGLAVTGETVEDALGTFLAPRG